MAKTQNQNAIKPTSESFGNKRATVHYNDKREAVNSFERIGSRLGSDKTAAYSQTIKNKS